MGTFKIRPTQLDSGGTSYLSNGDGVVDPCATWYAGVFLPNTRTIIQIIGQINDIDSLFSRLSTTGFISRTFNDILRFSFIGNSIYLDGSLTPISFDQLPIGWTPLTAILSVIPTPTTYSLPTLTQHFFLQFDPFTEGVQDTPTLAYSSPPTTIDLINNGCGIRVDISITNSGAIGGVQIDQLVIEGTYGIQKDVAQLVLLDPTIPIVPGDAVRFVITTAEASGVPTSGSIPQGTLSDVVQIQLDWTDLSGNPQTILIDNNVNLYSIIIQNDNQLWFTLPIGFGLFTGTVKVTFVFDGTTFSGSVLVGTLNVIFEDASGIYTLAKGQTNDELYFRAGFTTDTKLIMLPDMRSDEIYYSNDDLFSLLTYPTKILAQDYINEDDFEQSDFSEISALRQVIVINDVDIPSPFIKTAFLP